MTTYEEDEEVYVEMERRAMSNKLCEVCHQEIGREEIQSFNPEPGVITFRPLKWQRRCFVCRMENKRVSTAQ